MKVKRMKEEMAARAKELWMKAASAAAGKEKRTKKMLEAAIKIQVTVKINPEIDCAREEFDHRTCSRRYYRGSRSKT